MLRKSLCTLEIGAGPKSSTLMPLFERHPDALGFFRNTNRVTKLVGRGVLKRIMESRVFGSILRRIESSLLRFIDVGRPLAIQMDITNYCNLRCIHCYHPHHRNDGAIALSDWIKILDEYEALRKRMGFKPLLILCGGEPLLSPILTPLITRARSLDKDYRIMVLTNGTLVDRFDFGRLPPLGTLSFQVSLDGARSESHDQVRGKGSFDKSEKGVRRLIELGYPVTLQCVLSKRNAEDIADFFRTALNWGASEMKFTRLIKAGHAESMVANQLDAPLTPNELKLAYGSILKESVLSGVKTSCDLPLMHLLHPSLGSSGRFWEAIVIDHKGNLLASSRTRIELGNVLREGLAPLFLNSPLLKAIRSKKVDTCGKCQFYRRCGGDRNAAYAETGNYLGPDPGCWLASEKEGYALG